MREILFRGKLHNGEWSYGNLSVQMNGVAIITPDDTPLGKYGMVDRESVGQFTGLADKNGKRIFEGDVVRVSWHAPRRDTVYEVYEVVYSKSGFFTKQNGKLFGQISNYISPNVNMRCEVIGNIHDNPELLEVSNG